MTAPNTTTDDLLDPKPEPVKRFDCLSVVRDSHFATLCSRTRFGDVGFHRLTIGESCNAPRDFLQQANYCGLAVTASYDQLWILDVSDFDSYYAEKLKELRSYLAEEYSCANLNRIALPVLESAFERSVEGIAKLARKGAFGTARDSTLSNLDGLALGTCVFAQQLAAGA
jgi:hypothetical protein